MLLVLLTGACGRIGFQREDTALDAGLDAGLDAALDAALDAGPDGGLDGGLDGGGDGGPDGGPDGGADGGPDAGPEPDHCASIPALSTIPVIDGVPEPGLRWQALVPVDWTGAQPLPADLSARFAVAWRPSGLYVVVDVTDGSRVPAPSGSGEYCGDGVEIYADDDGTFASPPAYDVPGTRQAIAAAPGDDVTPVSRGSLWTTMANRAPWTSGFVAAPRPGGYVVEALIEASVLGLPSWTLAAGRRVGLDLSINVSLPGMQPGGDCGYRLGQYFLRVQTTATTCRGRPFCDVRAFCRPVLE